MISWWVFLTSVTTRQASGRCPGSLQARYPRMRPVERSTGWFENTCKRTMHCISWIWSCWEKLRPDLIVSQALCDVCAVSSDDVEAAVHAFANAPSVINLEPSRLEDVFRTIEHVGEAAGAPRIAENLVRQLRERVEAVKARTAELRELPKVVFLEWIDPPFNAGHWTPELIRLAGGIGCLGSPGAPSRTLDWAEVVAAQPDILVAACCGYDVARATQDLETLQGKPGWNGLPCVKSKRVFVLDGNAYFNRPGPRLVDSLELLANKLHPNAHPLPPPVGVGPAR